MYFFPSRRVVSVINGVGFGVIQRFDALLSTAVLMLSVYIYVNHKSFLDLH